MLNDLIVPDMQTALLQEAWDQFPQGKREIVEHSDSEDWRGGCPARRFRTVPGEQWLDSVYHSPDLRDFLRTVTGFPVEPSGQRGQYIFYCEPGDYISVHRDIESCDLVLITCLYDNRVHETGGGTLYFYPNRQDEPLSLIRQNPHHNSLGLALARGQTLLLLGGHIPHGTIPIVQGQIRLVSTLCFHVFSSHT